jgi:hypothetical protein
MRPGSRLTPALALVLAACSRALAPSLDTDSTPSVAPSSTAPRKTSTPASSAPITADPIEWQLTTPVTTFPMGDRGAFELWIVAHNAGTPPADTRRNGLEYLVNGQPSRMLAMAFGNGGRERRWAALPPGETVREARGGPTDPSFGQGLFPAPGDYDFTLQQDGRVVAKLHVRVAPAP